MSTLSFLGKLPASDSISGSLNALDLKKTLRAATVALIGVFALAFGGSISTACSPSSCDLSTVTMQSVLIDASQAGLAALGVAGMELLRRIITNNAK